MAETYLRVEETLDVLLGHFFLRLERVELDPARKAPLQLRDQVRRTGDVERAGRDEQDVVGTDRTVLGVDRRPLDDR